MKDVLLATLMAVQGQAPKDSAEAIREVQFLVGKHYASPSPWTSSCTGVTLQECRRGDWDCRAGDCNTAGSKLETLFKKVDALGPRAGASDWVIRQWVALAIKTGRLERARELADRCGGSEWQCMALRGLVRHQTDPAALAHFDSAVTRAPASVRCEWEDITLLVGQPAQLAALAMAGCSGDVRQTVGTAVERFWWLADPLWSRPGNERRAEHLARHMMWRTHEDLLELLDSIYNGRYMPAAHVRSLAHPRGRDIALGFYNSWRQARVSNPNAKSNCDLRPADSGRATAGRAAPCFLTVPRTYVNGGYAFTPDSRTLRSPVESSADDWAVEWNQGDERMYMRDRWYNLDHQSAVFRRGAGLLALAAARIPAELRSLDSLQVEQVLGRVADLALRSTPVRMSANRTLRASASIEGGYMTSIEVVGPTAVARARYGLSLGPLERGFGLSDIALVDTTIAGKMTLDDALLPSITLRKPGPTGLYFEVYGVDEQETLDLALNSQKINPSTVERLGNRLRLSSLQTLRVSWQEPATEVDQRTSKRVIRVDLSSLSTGSHRLELIVKRSNGQSATASRVINVSR